MRKILSFLILFLYLFELYHIEFSHCFIHFHSKNQTTSSSNFSLIKCCCSSQNENNHQCHHFCKFSHPQELSDTQDITLEIKKLNKKILTDCDLYIYHTTLNTMYQIGKKETSLQKSVINELHFLRAPPLV